MLHLYELPQHDKIVLIQNLQTKNHQLQQDNIALSNEVFRLRQIISYYESIHVKAQEFHCKQIQNMNNNTQHIMKIIELSDEKTKEQINNKLNELKKNVFYKKMANMEKRYEKKNVLCEELLGFRDKIIRLRNTWEFKKQDKSGQSNLQGLFIWVYNQIVKAKGKSPLTTRKNQKKREQTCRKSGTLSRTVSTGALALKQTNKTARTMQKTFFR